MTTWRWQRRDRKQRAERDRMPKSGRSVFDLERLIEEKARKPKKPRKR